MDAAALRDALAAQCASDAESLRRSVLDGLGDRLGGGDAALAAALLSCHRAELDARSAVAAAKEKAGRLGGAKALVDHARNKWIAEANANIREAQTKLDAAADAAAREAAEAEVRRWEQNRAEGEAALEERLEKMREAEAVHPAAERALAAAEEGMRVCRAETERALQMTLENRGSALTGAEMDAELARYQVYLDGTPAKLAEFASHSDEHQLLISDLLADEDLLVEIAVADGPRNGRYGEAISIFQSVRAASPRVESAKEAKEARGGRGSIFFRLALAVSLEHAAPYEQRNPEACVDGPAFIDPLLRYLHFESAYLTGELDPAFDTLTTWELRFVVDGEHGTPNEAFAWGREMLRNYRPDLILMEDYAWRYVHAVRTEIKYGSAEGKFDQKELHFFQNVLMNGGVCGRRAFFGRFILRAFGIPTTARPSPGHGALTHWTPKGWVVCLGPGWGKGRTKTKYGKDTDFLEHTEARRRGEPFMQVLRARWIGDVVGGERRCWGLSSPTDNLGRWNATALYLQRSLAEGGGERMGEAVASRAAEDVPAATIDLFRGLPAAGTAEAITVDGDNSITIPACATHGRGNGKILFMPCILGGKQFHYSRNGPHQPFEYRFDAPRGGTYMLTARVVTPSWKQTLLLSVNESEELIEIPLRFTVGMWDTTDPVNVELQSGRNVFEFRRAGDVKGVTIKDYKLKYVDWCLD